MIRTLRFYKETDHRWYIDLPEWGGSKADLEMVDGAGAMLDTTSEGNQQVLICMSDTYFENSDKMEFVEMATDIGNGAYYWLDNYKGFGLNYKIWLCDLALTVFGGFPINIFIAKSM